MKELIKYLRDRGLVEEALLLSKGSHVLNLSYNKMDKLKIKEVMEFLKTNTIITTLNLFMNKIDNIEAVEIAEALKINSTLTHLSFGCSNFSITSSNSIEDRGAKAIAKALKTNNTLTYLDLNLNGIGDQGLIELEVALVINTTLIYLDVGWNREKNTGYYAKQEIKKYIQRNKNIAEKKAETLNAEGNNLCSQGKYSDAIEKYTIAIKIMKSLHKENKLYEKNKINVEKKYEKQQQSLKLQQTTSVINENKPAEIKDLPKEAEKQDITQENLISSEENIYEVLARMNNKLENINNISEIDKETLQNNIMNKVTKLGRNKPNLQKTVKSIQDIIDSDKITKGKLIDLENEIEETIQQQAIINENIRIDKLNIFKQIVEKVNINVENNTSSNKAEMQNIINKIINDVSSLTNSYDIEKITASMEELTTGRVTKGKLIDVEDKLNEIILEQINKAANKVITWAVKEIIYDKPLLNHPKLLQAAVDSKLSPDLIHEAINNNDEELILAGLMSMGYDVTTTN
ncbi:leucine-rich repeat domain-containing protein [Rickettsia hoogstraalii]|uniref:hypothetical protein n=1 Tax=Rickettsia hoogstraalii TaxID=467174 RepID=UPI0009E512D4|nr:hypothetical protein [Rickettsia hoogstraalii]